MFFVRFTSSLLLFATFRQAAGAAAELNEAAGQGDNPITRQLDEAVACITNDFHVTVGGTPYDLTSIASSGVAGAPGCDIQKLYDLVDGGTGNHYKFTLPIAGVKPSETGSWANDLVQVSSGNYYGLGDYQSNTWVENGDGSLSVDFTGGSSFSCDQPRSATMTFQCSATPSTAVNEPTPCHYAVTFSDPSICAATGRNPTVTPSVAPTAVPTVDPTVLPTPVPAVQSQGKEKGKQKGKDKEAKTKVPAIVKSKLPAGPGAKGKSKQDLPKPAKKGGSSQTHTMVPKAPKGAAKGGSKKGGSK